jgi:membrane protein implicated in regulation of membrane protease activity
LNSQSLGQEVDTEIGADVDIDGDIDIEVDYDAGAEFDSVEANVEVDLDVEVDTDVDVDIGAETNLDMGINMDAIGTTTTPTPIMLLISAFLLVFGISGISLFYIITIEGLKFLMIITAPVIAYFASRCLNFAWKRITKSQYYKISTTENLIGRVGEVILPIDKRGGVIKIASTTPMKYEKLHAIPYNEGAEFERGTKVYIIDVKNSKVMVDINKNDLKKRGLKNEPK